MATLSTFSFCDVWKAFSKEIALLGEDKMSSNALLSDPTKSRSFGTKQAAAAETRAAQAESFDRSVDSVVARRSALVPCSGCGGSARAR